MFIQLHDHRGQACWVNPAHIAFMQQEETRGGQTITALTLTTMTSLKGPNGEPYQETTVLRVREAPEQIQEASRPRRERP